MTRQLLQTAVVVFVALYAAIGLVVLVTDDAFTESEARQLAGAFSDLTRSLPADVDVSGDRWAPAYPNLARDGDVEIGCAANGDYQVGLRRGGRMVHVTTLRLEWFPGASGWLFAAVFVLMALITAGVMTIPLVRRVRALEGAARAFAEGDHDARAPTAGRDELAHLAHHFNEMAATVQAQLTMQRAMMHAVAHEYRTPLARARLAAELLQDPADDDDKATQLDRIDAALDDLEGLADEVRDYARAEQRRVESLAEVDVSALSKRIVDTRPGGGVPIEVVAEEEALVVGDARLLQRIITNLVDNAAQHARSEVRVHVTTTDALVSVAVEDDGPGVPPDERERIFEPFVRLEGERRPGGFGLGLAIVRRMAETHGGLAAVDDSALGGARFTLELPRRR